MPSPKHVKTPTHTHKLFQLSLRSKRLYKLSLCHTPHNNKKKTKNTGKQPTLSWLLHLPGILVKDEWRKMWREAKRWRHVRRGREAPGKKHGGGLHETWPCRFNVMHGEKIMIHLLSYYTFRIFWQRNIDEFILVYI